MRSSAVNLVNIEGHEPGREGDRPGTHPQSLKTNAFFGRRPMEGCILIYVSVLAPTPTARRAEAQGHTIRISPGGRGDTQDRACKSSVHATATDIICGK